MKSKIFSFITKDKMNTPEVRELVKDFLYVINQRGKMDKVVEELEYHVYKFIEMEMDDSDFEEGPTINDYTDYVGEDQYDIPQQILNEIKFRIGEKKREKEVNKLFEKRLPLPQGKMCIIKGCLHS